MYTILQRTLRFVSAPMGAILYYTRLVTTSTSIRQPQAVLTFVKMYCKSGNNSSVIGATKIPFDYHELPAPPTGLQASTTG